MFSTVQISAHIPWLSQLVFSHLSSLSFQSTFNSYGGRKATFTCLSVNRAVYLKSLPSLLNNECGLSLIMNTMSDGILPLDWSPSFWKVTFVPDFHPGFIAMLTYLSSFFGVPSDWMTRLEIFIFFTQPLLISSRVAYRSCSMAGSWVFSFFNGVCTLNECDLMGVYKEG